MFLYGTMTSTRRLKFGTLERYNLNVPIFGTSACITSLNGFTHVNIHCKYIYTCVDIDLYIYIYLYFTCQKLRICTYSDTITKDTYHIGTPIRISILSLHLLAHIHMFLADKTNFRIIHPFKQTNKQTNKQTPRMHTYISICN
jgi:hypothetical protein